MKEPMKEPTKDEKIREYELLLHKIQLYAEITLDAKRLQILIANICRWSYAHRVGNGEINEEDQEKIIRHAFWKLNQLN